jgi:hypothetical protein
MSKNYDFGYDPKLLDSEDPKSLLDPENQRSICHYNGWDKFVNSICEAVANKDKYPCALLNDDNSISFFVSTDPVKDPSSFGSYCKDFTNSIEEGYFVKHLELLSIQREGGFIGEKFFEEKPNTLGDVIEYKFNISAENLDSILKLNPTYSSYRSQGKEGSILKLVKDFSLKPGSIMLWPLQSVDEEGKSFSVRAVGCQAMELPTLQLMKLLPNYESKILPSHKKNGLGFHWVPEEVEEGLMIDRTSLRKVLEKIFQDSDLELTYDDKEEFYPEELKFNDSAKRHGVKVVSMDENAQHFYALYGNIGKKELSESFSLEVKAMTFFEAIKDYLIQLEPDEELPEFSSERIANAIQNIDIMIEKERCPSSLVESPVVSTTNPRKGCVLP